MKERTKDEINIFFAIINIMLYPVVFFLGIIIKGLNDNAFPTWFLGLILICTVYLGYISLITFFKHGAKYYAN
jgi:hypothetical protein